MKHILSWILLSLLLLGLVACGDTPDITSATTTEAQTTTPVQTEPIVPDLVVIDESGKSEFTVVRADEADGITVNVAIALHTALQDTYQSKIGLSSDISIRREPDGTVINDKYEILIGDTNRPESIAARAELGENDYIICVKGKKLIILGVNGAATKYAVNLFMEQYVGQAGQALIIPADTRITGDGTTTSVALTAGADLRVMTFNLRGGEDNPYVRHPNIYETILTYMPDVIGCQEANNGHYPEVLNRLEDYAIVSTEMPVNCTPILYRKDKYTQVDGGCSYLRMRNTDTGTKSIAWVVLRAVETGKTFCVINLHGTLMIDWRMDNVREMLELKESIKSKYGDISVLSTGDFNFNSDEITYQLIRDAGLTEAELSAAVRMEGLGTWHPVGVAPGIGKSIDHIFGLNAVHFYVHGIIRGEDVYRASDHCPVYVDFGLT